MGFPWGSLRVCRGFGAHGRLRTILSPAPWVTSSRHRVCVSRFTAVYISPYCARFQINQPPPFTPDPRALPTPLKNRGAWGRGVSPLVHPGPSACKADARTAAPWSRPSCRDLQPVLAAITVNTVSFFQLTPIPELRDSPRTVQRSGLRIPRRPISVARLCGLNSPEPVQGRGTPSAFVRLGRCSFRLHFRRAFSVAAFPFSTVTGHPTHFWSARVLKYPPTGS